MDLGKKIYCIDLVKGNINHLHGKVISYSIFKEEPENINNFSKESIISLFGTNDLDYFCEFTGKEPEEDYQKQINEDTSNLLKNFGLKTNIINIYTAPIKFRDKKEICKGMEDVIFAGKHKDRQICDSLVNNSIGVYFSLFFWQLNNMNYKPERTLSEKEMLDLRLKAAVSKEDYETAAKIRDEIDRLK